MPRNASTLLMPAREAASGQSSALLDTFMSLSSARIPVGDIVAWEAEGLVTPAPAQPSLADTFMSLSPLNLSVSEILAWERAALAF